MCTWNYEYLASRKGEWEQIARDRARFQRRIEDVGRKISDVLKDDHRRIFLEKIWEKKDL